MTQTASQTVTHARKLSDGRTIRIEREIGEMPHIRSIEVSGGHGTDELNRALELVIAVAESYQSLVNETGNLFEWNQFQCTLGNGRIVAFEFMPSERRFRINPSSAN